MIEAIAAPLAALLSILSTPVAVAGSPAAAHRAAPVAGRTEPADRQDDGKPEDKKDPCPTELWSIPIELPGLACILLLPADGSEEQSPGRNR